MSHRKLPLGVAGAMVASVSLVAAAPAHAGVISAVSSTNSVTLSGHGWGHGRGMGQYGALGHAVNYGKTSAWILDHFYGGTVVGTAGKPEMTVELLAHSGKPLIVTGTGLKVNSTVVGAGAVRLSLQPNGTIKAEKGAGCVSAWTLLGTFAANSARVTTTAAPSSRANLLRVCEATRERAYRGSLAVVNQGATQMTINHLPTESYLRGVVPRESPASWADVGGGKGKAALQAQAVAARSYALASSRPSGARTCDTTSCQVYGGAGFKTGSAWTVLEDSRTDAALVATADVVRRRSGAVARTEFSSSTGGFTAGGTFPAVVDAGDSIANNPNSSWATTVALSDVASKLGTGAIRTIAVTARNGFGADGGRVANVRVVTTAGVVRNFSGNQVRTALGLKSDWFSISGVTLAETRSVVKALYADLLLRPVDSGGLATWSAFLAGGGSQTALVVALTRSRGYIRLRVGQAYRVVLGRAPDAGGLVGWTGQIMTGRGLVDDVQRRLHASQEFVSLSGGTNAGYVANVYKSILRRTATSGEVALWAAKMNQHGRGWFVDQIWFSPEAASARAGAYYVLFFKRAVDPVGRASWVQVLLAQGEGAVRVGIAGSMEYRLLALQRYP